jgi:hypothetical protein
MADFGNTATSVRVRSYQFDGQFNFETLYNKSAYLKDINTRFTGTQKKLPDKNKKRTHWQGRRTEEFCS